MSDRKRKGSSPKNCELELELSPCIGSDYLSELGLNAADSDLIFAACAGHQLSTENCVPKSSAPSVMDPSHETLYSVPSPSFLGGPSAIGVENESVHTVQLSSMSPMDRDDARRLRAAELRRMARAGQSCDSALHTPPGLQGRLRGAPLSTGTNIEAGPTITRSFSDGSSEEEGVDVCCCQPSNTGCDGSAEAASVDGEEVMGEEDKLSESDSTSSINGDDAPIWEEEEPESSWDDADVSSIFSGTNAQKGARDIKSGAGSDENAWEGKKHEKTIYLMNT